MEKEITNSISVINIDLTPLTDRDAKLRDFVSSTMHILLDYNLIPEDEIKNLLDDDYGYETFELVAPNTRCAFFTTDKEKTKIEIKGNRRYGQECFGGKYYLCNEWRNLDSAMHEKAKRQRVALCLWLETIAEMNSKIRLISNSVNLTFEGIRKKVREILALRKILDMGVKQVKNLGYPILVGDLKKAIANYKDDAFIEFRLTVNGDFFVCMDENTEVSLIDEEEGEDLAGILEINFNEK